MEKFLLVKHSFESCDWENHDWTPEPNLYPSLEAAQAAVDKLVENPQWVKSRSAAIARTKAVEETREDGKYMVSYEVYAVNA
ncbi:MAG: hypothetical protein IJ419_11515 [Agathobacter sp.]|nr:hypothetical protein [Agathobacter sp.]